MDEIKYAIGDLGVARRHIARIKEGMTIASRAAREMIVREVSESIDRCVTRLNRLGGPDGMTFLALYLPPEIDRALTLAGVREDRSKTDLIREMIQAGLAKRGA